MTSPSLLNIAASIILLTAGMISIFFSFFKIRQKEYTLLNIGLFFFLYGMRWLIEENQVENVSEIYMHSLLTYLIPIPFAGFILNILGKGLFRSLYWFFISSIIYAVIGIVHDLFSPTAPLSPSINTFVLALWILTVSINVVLIQEQGNPILKVLKTTLYFFLFCLAYDNLVIMDVFPWHFRLEHIDALVLFIGMVSIAVLRFRDPHWKAGNVPVK